ncbi:MAG: Vitamin transporter BtuB [Bacteroidota bacterium]|jgi:TonB-linked SusC/RagA family outer membrane protein
MKVKLFTGKLRDQLFLFSMIFLFAAMASAQKKVTGTVSSKGIPLAGANVNVKGSKTGVSTDIDGKFTLNVPNDAKTIVVSYLGYATKEVAVSDSPLTIELAEESNKLEEVVINVGYGTQKKSVVTGAISKVNARDLEKVPNGNVGTALQGRVSGVTVAANSGAPGSSATIRVRGVTTFGDNSPLIVIDNVVMPIESLNAINQQDIESMEVLKDAASAAIYGTRAAKGVILITTKKGKKGKMSVSYNGFTGSSAPRKTINLLNATEYATIMNEKSLAGGGPIKYPNPAALGAGTDWQSKIFNNNAMRSNHELSLSGGNDASTFFVSLGMQNQEGIVASEISNSIKKTVRFNSTHKISDRFTIGQNFTYANITNVGIGSMNTEFGGVMGSAIMLDPTTPAVVTDPVVASGSPYNASPWIVRDPNGNPYGLSTVVGQEIANPLALIQILKGNRGWSDDFFGNMYLEGKIIDGLKFRSSFGGKRSTWGNDFFTPKFYLNASYNNTNKNSLTRNMGRALDWTITNNITYDKRFNDHNVSAMLGYEVNNQGIGYYMGVTHSGLPVNNYQDANFNYAVAEADKKGYSYDFIPHKLTSAIARLTYDYKEKYLFNGIYRVDGSTKFGRNNKYGKFPSVSLGWVASKEDFWKENKVIDFLKFRAGYGVTGDTGNLGNFYYASAISGGYNYTLGPDGQIFTGNTIRTVENPDLHWEETKQTNIGFDARLFKNFNLTVEYYNKKTSGILQQVRIPGYVGVADLPWANVADMTNKGIEFEMGYKKQIGQLNLSASANFSTLKNEVTNIGAGVDFITQDAPGFQSMGPVTRTQVGEAYNSFYGFQTAGIFQNQAEINAYTNSTGGLIQPNAQPGDFRWVDNNGDGQITDADKKFLGSPIPKYTFGFTFNADYKGFDLYVFTQGVAGNKIFQGYRRLDISEGNFTTEALNRWTGEGTSNDFPRITSNDTNGNFGKMSDFYLQKGDYIRLKIVQLGYSLPTNVIKKIGASKIRLYVSGENLITLTKYNGYDPEIGGTVMGIDKGYYPQPRTYFFGANLQF